MKNVAVWGLGAHARRNLLPALASADGIRLVGVWTRDAGTRQAVAAEYDVTAYDSAQHMLADPDSVAVVLATPVGMHSAHAQHVLEAGKDLWCEKSLASTSDEAQLIDATAQQCGRQAHELFMFLWHPQFLELKRLLAEGVIGEVRGLSARFGFPHLPSTNIRYDAALGGGALLDAGCYPYAAAHSLLGPTPEIAHQHLWSDPGYSVDTRGSAMLIYSGGRRAMLEWGFGHAYRNELEVWGSDGSLLSQRAFSKPSTLQTSIDIRLQDGTTSRVAVAPANHFQLMFEAMDGRTSGDWLRDQSALLGAGS